MKALYARFRFDGSSQSTSETPTRRAKYVYGLYGEWAMLEIVESRTVVYLIGLDA